ncbi:hypothetical protein ACIP79_10470 [Streptomyces sp. NPDC088747]|uniref:hypothetical protein n=1 Tax=Streptomyces sp. NPDC088747 TaxID=3365886 RepID=UPI0038007ACC
MRRSLFFAVLVGMLVALLPAGTAAADTCGRNLKDRLECWSGEIDEHGVLVTLDSRVPFDAEAADVGAFERTLWDKRENLVVEVPKGARTGAGGTALLLLAGTGWVAPDATIDRLPREHQEGLPACDSANADPTGSLKEILDVCDRLAEKSLTGEQLIAEAPATFRAKHTYTVAAEESSGRDTLLIAVVGALLLALLTALVLIVRRSSRAGHQTRPALATAGAGPVPTAPGRAADEETTRLRTTPAPRYGRRVGNVPGPAKSAVVRTELHPQGYVELDRVLYRAVWAEPGRPPPAPGALVDVTEARERDSDVLYAFPPTSGRHAKGTRT